MTEPITTSQFVAAFRAGRHFNHVGFIARQLWMILGGNADNTLTDLLAALALAARGLVEDVEDKDSRQQRVESFEGFLGAYIGSDDVNARLCALEEDVGENYAEFGRLDCAREEVCRRGRWELETEIRRLHSELLDGLPTRQVAFFGLAEFVDKIEHPLGVHPEMFAPLPTPPNIARGRRRLRSLGEIGLQTRASSSTGADTAAVPLYLPSNFCERIERSLPRSWFDEFEVRWREAELPDEQLPAAVRERAVQSADELHDSVIAAITGHSKPVWDSVARILRIGGQEVLRYRRQAPNQMAILAGFEADSWPHSIDNPLLGDEENSPEDQLNHTLKDLNKKLSSSPISLHARGDKVVWERRST